MRNRAQIIAAMNIAKDAIEIQKAHLQELTKEACLLSDEEQFFEEKMESFGKGKTKENRLIGRIHWKETFYDEDTKEPLIITRSRIVRINGEWTI